MTKDGWSVMFETLRRSTAELHESLEKLQITRKELSYTCVQARLVAASARAPGSAAVGSPYSALDRDGVGASARALVRTLTCRQRNVLERVLAGHPSKAIAFDLRISQKTVETHRARIMRKLQVDSVPALTRLAYLAGVNALATAGQ